MKYFLLSAAVSLLIGISVVGQVVADETQTRSTGSGQAEDFYSPPLGGESCSAPTPTS